MKTPPFSGDRDPDLEFWIKGVRNAIYAELARSRSKTLASSAYSNMFPLIRYAMNVIKNGDLMFFPNDKSAGFTAMSVYTYRSFVLATLDSNAYMPLSRQAFIAMQPYRAYTKLCEEVSRYREDASVGRALRRSLMAPGAKDSAVLKILTKAHKPQGAVSHRNLHACPSWKFGGLALWVDFVVTSRLKEVAPHLLSGSEDLVRRLRCLSLSGSSKFIRIDLEEFFMSGNPEELTGDLHRLWPADSCRLGCLLATSCSNCDGASVS